MTVLAVALGAYGTWLLYTGLALAWPSILPAPVLPGQSQPPPRRLSKAHWRVLILELRRDVAAGLPAVEALVLAARDIDPVLGSAICAAAGAGPPSSWAPGAGGAPEVELDDAVARVVVDLAGLHGDGALDGFDGALAALTAVLP